MVSGWPVLARVGEAEGRRPSTSRSCKAMEWWRWLGFSESKQLFGTRAFLRTSSAPCLPPPRAFKATGSEERGALEGCGILEVVVVWFALLLR